MRFPFSFNQSIRTAINRPDVGSQPLFDEALLAKLRRVVLLSGHARAAGVAGEHRSRRRGASPEFADFKSYSQGDDYRRIDWNTYARLNGVFVRLSEVTTELNVHILLDASDSMDWRASLATDTKLRYACRVVGALGYVALWHFDRLTIAPFGAGLGAPYGPSQGRAHIVPMLTYLERLRPLGPTALTATLDRYARARRRPGLLLIVSDLLSSEPAEVRDQLRWLRGQGWQVMIIQVLDEAEVTTRAVADYLTGDLPAGAAAWPIELVEIETADRLRLTPTSDLIDRYVTSVTSWLTAIESACRDEAANHVRLETSWDFSEVVLGMLYQAGVVA